MFSAFSLVSTPPSSANAPTAAATAPVALQIPLLTLFSYGFCSASSNSTVTTSSFCRIVLTAGTISLVAVRLYIVASNLSATSGTSSNLINVFSIIYNLVVTTIIAMLITLWISLVLLVLLLLLLFILYSYG